jgi:hypothetical protein
VVNQPYEFSERGLSTKINDPVQLRVVMPFATYLHELDLATKVVHHRLVTRRLPPLNGDVVLAARRD